MALVTLEEAKTYLRVDFEDEDAIISTFIQSAEKKVRDVGRIGIGQISDEKWETIIADPTEEDTDEIKWLRSELKVSIMYAVDYMYNHREETGYHSLMFDLRDQLSSIREGVI